jgi:hypothetical protein
MSSMSGIASVALQTITRLNLERVVADVVLINPRFELSFWGFQHCMRLFGKRARSPKVQMKISFAAFSIAVIGNSESRA